MPLDPIAVRLALTVVERAMMERLFFYPETETVPWSSMFTHRAERIKVLLVREYVEKRGGNIEVGTIQGCKSKGFRLTILGRSIVQAWHDHDADVVATNKMNSHIQEISHSKEQP